MSVVLSAFSSRSISVADMDRSLARLQATRDGRGGWTLTRDDRSVDISIGTEGIEAMFDESERQAIGEELGGPPISRVVFYFNDSRDDRFEYRMALAVTKAMAEKWPVLIDDHFGERELVRPPGGGPKPS